MGPRTISTRLTEHEVVTQEANKRNRINNNRPISMIARTGNPNLNAMCLVLCRNQCIPMVVPIAPPMIAILHRVASGIRYCLCFAFSLSLYMMYIPMMFIKIEYINKIFSMSVSLLWPSHWKQVYLPRLATQRLLESVLTDCQTANKALNHRVDRSPSPRHFRAGRTAMHRKSA